MLVVVLMVIVTDDINGSVFACVDDGDDDGSGRDAGGSGRDGGVVKKC